MVWAAAGSSRPTTLTKPGSYDLAAAAWVLHNRVLYSSLGTPLPPTLNVTFGPVSGAWSRITDAGSNLTVTAPLFSLDVVHPTLGSDCSYAVTTNVSSPAQAARVFAKLAAVHRSLKTGGSTTSISVGPGTILSTVWAPGLVSAAGGGISLEVDTACVLTASKSSSALSLSIANPENAGRSITIKANGMKFKPFTSVDGFACKADGTVIVVLPGGLTAGSTVSGRCELG